MAAPGAAPPSIRDVVIARVESLEADLEALKHEAGSGPKANVGEQVFQLRLQFAALHLDLFLLLAPLIPEESRIIPAGR